MLADTNGWDFLAVFFTTVGAIVVAGLPLWWKVASADRKAGVARDHAAEAKQTGEDVRDAVGIPNGNGDLVQMVTRILGGTAEMVRFKDDWEKSHAEVIARLDALEAKESE